MDLEKKKSPEAGGETAQYVVFRVAKEDYCIEILKVQEIIRMVTVTWLPRKPPYIIGVINLRGEIIPVLDLRIKFGLEKKEYNKFTRILITQIQEKLVGMVVDQVEEVIELTPDMVEQEPDLVAAGRSSSDYIRAIAKIEERVVIVLDIGRVLSKEDVISISDVSVSENQGGA